MVDVHQCPRCELRFVTKNELTDHFDREHATFEDPLKTGRPHLLTDDEIEAALGKLTGWTRRGGAIERTCELESFPAAIDFVGRVATLAEAADHHPDIDIRFRTVRLALSTHSAGGITGKDVDLAARIDRLLG